MRLDWVLQMAERQRVLEAEIEELKNQIENDKNTIKELEDFSSA